MSIFRSYLKKNSTLISGVLSNNSRNPVTEISYGTPDKQISRFIFDIELSELQSRINSGKINSDNIIKHTLHMTNTIRYAPEYIGGKTYFETTERASSFDLELFNINEDWDEGAGYTFVYSDTTYPQTTSHASNWIERKTNTNWSVSGGSYSSGSTIVGIQRFDNGNEDLEVDVTDYIQAKLASSGSTYGLGLKFLNEYEALSTDIRKAVAFHAKRTNTYYEPYIETTINDSIVDDRNFFLLDKDNSLFLYSNIGNEAQNIVVNSVTIYDHEDNAYTIIPTSGVTYVNKGVFKITVNVDSSIYPDAVIFRDEWNITVNSKSKTISNQFYLISENQYNTFDLSNEINPSNYYFTFSGISEREHITAGITKKIKILLREFYANQNNSLPLEIQYRVFTTISNKYELDIVPFTDVNRTSRGLEFNLDTSWLIPQDYKLQIRMKNGDSYETKQTLFFTVVSNGLIKN